MIHFRKANQNDREAILDLINKSFSMQGNDYNNTEGEEHRVLFSYLYARPTWKPEWLYVAEQDGKLLATAGYFPKTLSFEEITIPVGAISPVATDPEYRGQGLARECLNKVLENLQAQRVPLVFLWGLPSYYPKLGFVPVLPRYKTKITSKEIMKVTPECSGRFRTCSLQDVKSLHKLYYRDQHQYWLQPLRSLEWWQERFTEIDSEFAFIKEVPFPKKENFIVWENNSGELSGYLNYSSEYFNHQVQANDQKVVIDEAVSIDPDCTSAMLHNFLAKYIKPAQTVYIRGTPEHSLNAAAYRMGGMHLNPAPLAGMVKVIDWQLFLKLLTPLFGKRLSNIRPLHEGINLSWIVDNGQIQFKMIGNLFSTKVIETQEFNPINDNRLLTRLIFGIYDHFDIEMTNKVFADCLPVLFPSKYPFIWDANYLY